MAFADQQIHFPAKFDYGSRSGRPTLALVFHMAEGFGVAQYLATGNIARGVSVHYTIEAKAAGWDDGEVVRCLPEGRISGSVNPDTIRTSDGPYYGARHAKGALGAYWRNPNVAVVSVEVAGRAKDGPTKGQAASMVELFKDLRRRHPGIVPLGHADLQDVKPCPGTSFLVKRAFELMGGHGLENGEVQAMSTVGYVSGQVADVKDGTDLFDAPSGKKIGDVGAPLTRDYLGKTRDGDWSLVSSVLDGKGRTAWVRSATVTDVRTPVVAPADCATAVDDAKAAALARARTAVDAALEALA